MSRRIAGVNVAQLTPIFSCPSCDYVGASIATKANVTLNAFGDASNATWYYASHAKCLFCGYTGSLNEFDIEQRIGKKV